MTADMLEQLRQALQAMKHVSDAVKLAKSVPEEDVWFAVSTQVTRRTEHTPCYQSDCRISWYDEGWQERTSGEQQHG